ncbi:antibiotic biosynthesis monooxygenase [candidate division KSB1 bacterium]|nr:antibiotic biosynthesis monooxygenase [candidate division KSB1 bacterium]
MHATCVYVWVKQEHIQDFIQASIANHNASVREAGNLRFDVLQCADDPSRFILYEAYESDEAAAAHKKTAHYLKWRETVSDWMAKPREGVKHHIICPTERTTW